MALRIHGKSLTVKNVANSIKGRIRTFHWNHFYLVYRYYIRLKAWKIRKKERIKVLFILAELGAWKTEALYWEMLAHPRFEPVLGVTTSQEVPGSKQPLVEYIKSKGYDYVDLDRDKDSIRRIRPDIKFYYKPYDESYPPEFCFRKYMGSLMCFINYGLCSTNIRHFIDKDICNYSWFSFADNESVAECRRQILGRKGANVVATGVPMQDQLLLGKEHYSDPWKPLGTAMKRIIYAPHHSIPGTNISEMEYSTVMKYGDFILELARKYSSEVQWAFKPHPTLYKKLLVAWGEERTENYYKAWKEMENAQLELGEYSALFRYSDAMIHDCSSFMIEYHATKNPVMFLLDGKDIPTDTLNKFGENAYKVSYKGRCSQDIETFVKNVIEGIDPMKAEREDFYRDYLLPPGGSTACANIIDKILN